MNSNHFTFADKERDIELRTTAIKRELENEKARQQKLSDEIKQLNEQLREASNGLMAAARLSDQLELNQHTIERLNNESKLKRILSSRGSVNFYLTSCSKKAIFHHSFSFVFMITKLQHNEANPLRMSVCASSFREKCLNN